MLASVTTITLWPPSCCSRPRPAHTVPAAHRNPGFTGPMPLSEIGRRLNKQQTPPDQPQQQGVGPREQEQGGATPAAHAPRRRRTLRSQGTAAPQLLEQQQEGDASDSRAADIQAAALGPPDAEPDARDDKRKHPKDPDDPKAAVEAGLRRLSMRAMSRHEVAAALAKAGFTARAAEAALARLAELVRALRAAPSCGSGNGVHARAATVCVRPPPHCAAAHRSPTPTGQLPPPARGVRLPRRARWTMQSTPPPGWRASGGPASGALPCCCGCVLVAALREPAWARRAHQGERTNCSTVTTREAEGRHRP